DLTVRREGGFTGPIDLAVGGLPAGVKVEPARVADNQVAVRLAVSAANDARPASGVLRISGRAMVAGKARERVATAVPVGGADGVCGGLPNDAVYWTVQHKPIFRLDCNEAYQYAHRGTVYPYKLKVERLNGFTGEIVLQICDRQV